MSLFVGRERELATLRAVLRSGRRGGPAVAIVFGDPGAGKSRLLHEALAGASGARVMPIVGYEPEAPVPLAAARSLIREASTAGRHGGRLQRLLGQVDPDAGRLDAVRVFEAVHHCLAELAPVVLAADDLQWADEVSLALCHFVMRAARADGYGLTFLGASRESPAVRRFAASLGDAFGSRHAMTTIELGPLEQEAGIALLRELDPELGNQAATELYRRAGGSPFWLGALGRASDAATEIDSLVTSRMRRVSADAAWLLGLLAVRGIPTSVPQLASLLEWPADRVDAAVRELVGVGVTVIDGAVIRLGHDLIRDAAIAAVPTRDVAFFHRRLAATLERDAGDDVQVLFEAIEHRAAAGMRTLDLVERILRSPGRRLLGQDGVNRLADLLDSAERGLASTEHRTGPEPAWLHGELAALARAVGLPRLALELWRKAAAKARLPSQRARATVEGARVAFLQLRELELGERLLHESRSASSEGAVGIEQDVLESLMWRHVRKDADTASRIAARALASADRAVEERRRAGLPIDDELRSAWREALGGAYDEARLTLDDPTRMLTIAERMVEAAGSSPEALLLAEFGVAMALRAQGRLADAERVFESVWRRAQDWSLPLVAAETGYWLGDVLRALGSLDASRRIARETMRVGQRVADPRAEWDAGWLLRVLDLSTGDWRAAIAGLAADLSREPDPHARIETHTTIAEWLARFGDGRDREVVDRHLVEGESDVAAAACERCRREFVVRAAETRARIGQLDDAARALDGWDAERSSPSPLSRLWRLRAGGALALARSEPAAAVAQWQQQHQLATEMGMRLETCRVRLDLASALAERDVDEAIEILRAAVIEARAIGASSEARAAERHLRGLGVRLRNAPRARPSPRSNAHGLTASELAVARMAASGASNREIAAALFITPKTVERHVSRALAKLGARNRTELARRIDGLIPAAG